MWGTGGRVRCGGSRGSAGRPWGHLCPNAGGPRTQPALGRQPHSRNFHLLNMALSFSPSPALARVRSLSLSLPSSPSPPCPPHPECSLCSAGPGCGLAVSGPSGGFSPLSGKRRSAEHCVPGGVCSRVRARARKGSKQLRPRAVALSLPPSLPSSLVRSPTSLRSLSLIHPAEGLAHSLLLC